MTLLLNSPGNWVRHLCKLFLARPLVYRKIRLRFA